MLRSSLTDSDQLVVLSTKRSNGTSNAAWTRVEGEPFAPLIAADGSRLTPDSLPIAVTRKGKLAMSGSGGLWVGPAEHLKLIAKIGVSLRAMSDTSLMSIKSIQLNERGHMVLLASVQQGGSSKEKLLRYSPAAGFESSLHGAVGIDSKRVRRHVAPLTT